MPGKHYSKTLLLALMATLSACAIGSPKLCDASAMPDPLDPVVNCKSEACVRQQCVLFCRKYPSECGEVCGGLKQL